MTDNMELAKSKGLVIRNTNDSDYYDLLVFDTEKSAQKIADSVELSNRKRYDEKSVYDMLLKAGEGRLEKLEYVRFVMTDDTIKDDDAKEAFTWNLASRVVRKNITFKKELEHTLEVAEEVEKRIAVHNPKVVDDNQIVLFADALKWEFVSYNARRKKWSVMIDDVEKAMGGVLGDNLKRMCAHYFGFMDFIKLDADILAGLREKIDELNSQIEIAKRE